jgi:hypothetical protein
VTNTLKDYWDRFWGCASHVIWLSRSYVAAGAGLALSALASADFTALLTGEVSASKFFWGGVALVIQGAIQEYARRYKADDV